MLEQHAGLLRLLHQHAHWRGDLIPKHLIKVGGKEAGGISTWKPALQVDWTGSMAPATAAQPRMQPASPHAALKSRVDWHATAIASEQVGAYRLLLWRDHPPLRAVLADGDQPAQVVGCSMAP